jgi:hypothetical protein
MANEKDSNSIQLEGYRERLTARFRQVLCTTLARAERAERERDQLKRQLLTEGVEF